MNMKKFLGIVIHIFGVFLFLAAAGYALLTAYGYQVDLLNRNIVKTSILDIESKLDNVSVFIDEEFITDKLPYQVKNLSPGSHNLSVYRPGYIRWQKNIEIREDIVTTANGIIMVPEDVNKISDVIKEDFEFTDIVYNKKYILFIDKNLNKIHVYNFYNDGNYSIDHINYIFNNVSGPLYFADTDRVVIPYKDSAYILDLQNKSTKNIIIPDEFNTFYVAYNPGLKAFYVNDGSIYTADIDENSSIKSNSLIYEFEDKVVDNFELIKNNSDIFLKFNNELFFYTEGELEKIDDNVIKNPVFSETGDIYYIRKGQEIIKYNLQSDKKKLLARFSEKIDCIESYEKGKHIYIKKGDNLSICDIDFENCFDLLNVQPEKSLVIMSGSPYFITADEEEVIKYDLR